MNMQHAQGKEKFVKSFNWKHGRNRTVYSTVRGWENHVNYMLQIGKVRGID